MRYPALNFERCNKCGERLHDFPYCAACLAPRTHHTRSEQLTEGVNLVVLWAFACGIGLGYVLGVWM